MIVVPIHACLVFVISIVLFEDLVQRTLESSMKTCNNILHA